MKKQSKGTVFLGVLTLLLLWTTLMIGCGTGDTPDNSNDDGQPTDTDPDNTAPGDSDPEEENSSFPISVWLQQPRLAQQYKAIGINLYIGLWDGPDSRRLRHRLFLP